MRSERQKTAQNRALKRDQSGNEIKGIYGSLQASTIVPPSWEDADQMEIAQKEEQMALCIEHWMQRWWPDPHNRPIQIPFQGGKETNQKK